MLTGCDIVCVSSLDWDAHWTSKQQIMHRLARGNRILYVEEPVTMLAPLRVPSRLRRLTAVPPRLRRAEDNLWVLTPPPLLPFGNLYPAVNRVNQAALGAYVRWGIERLRLRDYVLWTYLPTSVHLLGHLDPSMCVYHCVDEHSAFPGFVDPITVRAFDDELTARADLVVTTAAGLRDRRSHLNEHVYHVPNAADVGHFMQALDPATVVPDDLASITPPRIGVVGVHDERLDVEAIEAIARVEPGWSVVLIGPVQPGDVDVGRLSRLENVHLLGGRPMSSLPSYLKGLDVALIPYRLNELTRNIFPLKLFEYLAAGLPVVAAALPELRPFAGWIRLAEDPHDYAALVHEAMSTEPGRREELVALARRNTWEDRVERISSLVEEARRRIRVGEQGVAGDRTSGGDR